MKKTIHIIRHGQTDYNKAGIIQGSGIDSHLNTNGILQRDLFFSQYQEAGFECIFTSQLKRTIQSVQPFIETGFNHLELAALNEINWGIFEGLKSTPEYHKKYVEIVGAWKAGDYHKRIEGGESAEELYNRQKTGLQTILESPYQNILICMHGRALRSFLCLLTHTPLHQMDTYPHSNLCLYQLEGSKAGDFEIKIRNCTEHLRGITPS